MAGNYPVFSRKFCRAMAIYAVCVLLVATIGGFVWWDFIKTYELSRPKTAVNAYLENLTPELVCEGSEELLSKLDVNLQSREKSCAVICDALGEGFHAAKKSKESSEDRQIYALMSGRQEIGSFSILAGEQGKYGFRIWEPENAVFDLSYLVGQPIEVTVPEDFSVCIEGKILTGSYITERDVPYEALEDFYGKFELPSLATYRLASYLGNLTVEVLDKEGNPVLIDADTDYASFLPACTDADCQEIETFVPEFLDRYVNFSGGAKNSIEVNFKRLKQVSATDGELIDLFYSALKGLRFAASRKDTIQEITINRMASLPEDRYYCDVTFLVETIGRSYETVHTENNMKLILVREEDGLKAESLVRY